MARELRRRPAEQSRDRDSSRTSVRSSPRSAAGCARTRSTAARCLDGYDVDEMATARVAGRCSIPWPNRHRRTGATSSKDVGISCRSTSRSTRSAIHGLVALGRLAAWREREPHRVVHASTILHPQPGYPFTLDARHRVRARPRTASACRRRRRTSGQRRARTGAARIPYLTLGRRRSTTCRAARARRGRVLEADERGDPGRRGRRRRHRVRLPRAARRRRREARPRASPTSSATTTASPGSR